MSLSWASLLFSFLLFPTALRAQSTDTTLVPALITFGDSTVDVGNNNHLSAVFKANFLPYGMDYTTHMPTGRFCDGKLVTDFTAEALGFTSPPPAYLSPEASRNDLMFGASFASAGSGYYEGTAAIYNAISLDKQMEYYEEYRKKLAGLVGESKAASILAGAMHLLSTGSGDYIQNYYINATLQKRYKPEDYSSVLVRSFARFVKGLHRAGARRIGVTSLAPVGCFPAPMNLFGGGGCIARFNLEAKAFNRKLNATAAALSKALPGLTLVVMDVYGPLRELITSPSKHGFTEAKKGCCWTGTSRASVLCKRQQTAEGICENAAKYVFWDGVHPSQAANRFVAQSLMLQGIPLIP